METSSRGSAAREGLSTLPSLRQSLRLSRPKDTFASEWGKKGLRWAVVKNGGEAVEGGLRRELLCKENFFGCSRSLESIYLRLSAEEKDISRVR